ncbi:hypothetical protein SDC9_87268 [bioreactor metagenome]|uniref:Uncharacterized protein n=1 Tax=bioreactor metagenome TaxID=1076179 RepID=A0A644ZSR1_9ZZZZ
MSLSRVAAVTSSFSFSLNLLAVDLTIAKASGKTSSKTSSIFSSILFVILSTSVARASFSETSIITSSSLPLSSKILDSSTDILSEITFFNLAVSPLSWSFERLSNLEYAS